MLKNLRILRNERGISQQKLADIIGMTQSSINGYENHNIEPDIATLMKIADYFETSVDFIVGHTHIRRKIEEVSEFALNEQEAVLINRYRTLAVSSRKAIDNMIVEMIKS
ncbi:MAG: helix-turn-helix domain-containing protein [Oscillospiraceae bacterium]|nr:helix-turn-helix domain-containing protein [Oscillospiraceae bacterium]